jgi:hypothetical protein
MNENPNPAPPNAKMMVPDPDDAWQHSTPPEAKVQISDIAIGCAVTIKGCGVDPISEGAAVL